MIISCYCLGYPFHDNMLMARLFKHALVVSVGDTDRICRRSIGGAMIQASCGVVSC